MSHPIVLNTGVPQGCVLSPLLFSVYTNELKMHCDNFKLFKYADDKARVALLHRNNANNEYSDQVSKLEQWCKSSSLIVNVEKIKELILRHPEPLPGTTLCCQSVDIVNCLSIWEP
ncbi:hypothetical protein LDENG_00131940 [Lucifuga dentata]|nr:hypothetical protein LDENG_00131940 [Lucifuga dentata]